MRAAVVLSSIGVGVRRFHPGLAAVSVSVWVATCLFRLWYVLRAHHPRHFVYDDAWDLLSAAHRLVEGRAPTRLETIWPPGIPVTLALGLSADANLEALAWAQALTSALLPVAIAHATKLILGDARAAHLALLVASLHFGLAHYSGFFLSEHWFAVWMTAALWASEVTLRDADGSSLFTLVWRGTAAGLIWGTASLFRPNALPVALFVGATLLVRSRGRRSLARTLAAGVFGAALVVLPASHRCTALVGSVCPVSANAAMNLALGQSGEFAELEFRSPRGSAGASSWRPPSLPRHGYSGVGLVPATIWETGQILEWVFDRLASNPAGFAWRSLGNGLDLFGLTLWPEDYGPLASRNVYVWSQLFSVLVLVPALVGYARALALIRTGTASRGLWLVWGAATGLVLSSMLSLGEARYRVPFDAVFIVLAAFAWRGTGQLADATRSYSRPLVGVALLAAFVGATVLAVSHPWASLRLHASTRPPHQRALAHVAASADGQWRPPRAHVFRCTPDCDAVEVTLGRSAASRRIDLLFGCGEDEPLEAEPAIPPRKLDGNFYRVAILHHERELYSQTVEGSPGFVVTVTPPERQKFDSVRIQPLYGDGYYSLRLVDVQAESAPQEVAERPPAPSD